MNRNVERRSDSWCRWHSGHIQQCVCAHACELQGSCSSCARLWAPMSDSACMRHSHTLTPAPRCVTCSQQPGSWHPAHPPGPFLTFGQFPIQDWQGVLAPGLHPLSVIFSGQTMLPVTSAVGHAGGPGSGTVIALCTEDSPGTSSWMISGVLRLLCQGLTDTCPQWPGEVTPSTGVVVWGQGSEISMTVLSVAGKPEATMDRPVGPIEGGPEVEELASGLGLTALWLCDFGQSPALSGPQFFQVLWPEGSRSSSRAVPSSK